MIGKSLGHYEIIEPLGAGGMGEVYRAHDTNLKRDVAIKVLPEDLAADQERLARLEREAHLLAALNHPNIASIYSLEESDGTRFLVLELAEGQTLDKRLASGRIEVEEALEVAKQIAQALEAAHEQGIIHRDLKPSNVTVTDDGKVKVLDFGLAKAFEVEGEAEGDLSRSPTITVEGTRTGVIMGTAAYMSPEQAKGKPLDKRTDIFSFGAVLYEMLTGQKPFVGEDVSETMAAILRDEPDWNVLPTTTPLTAQALLGRCLRKDPDRRLHDIADARIEIEEALSATATDLPGSPTGAKGAERHPLLWGVAGIVVGALAVGLVFWAAWPSTSGPRPSTSRVAITLPEGAESFDPNSVAVSPDGTRVAFQVQIGDELRLYLRSLDDLDAVFLYGASRDPAMTRHRFFFSPDSEWLGFAADDKLWTVQVSGGKPVAICDAPAMIRGASWGENDMIIFGAEGLRRVSASGGEPEILISPDSGERLYSWPKILPGGAAVLFSMRTEETGIDSVIAVLDLETGDKRLLVEGDNPHYVPTGHLIYADEGVLLAAPFDVNELQIVGTAVPVLDETEVNFRGFGDDEAFFSVSESGLLLYSPPDPQPRTDSLVWVDRAGNVERLSLRPAHPSCHPPRLNPDGRRLVIDDQDDVWIHDLVRNTAMRLTSDPATDAWPAWTPDGQHVLFASTRAGGSQVFMQRADGSELPRLMAKTRNGSPEFVTPDGEVLVYLDQSPSGDWDIWAMAMDGSSPELAVLNEPFNEWSPAVSPDGKWLAYNSDETGTRQVYVRPFPGPGGKNLISAQEGYSPLWAPSGKELFYWSADTMMVVSVTLSPEFVAGTPEPLFEVEFETLPPGWATYYDIHPSGTRFVMHEAPPEPIRTHLILVLNWSEELKRLR